MADIKKTLTVNLGGTVYYIDDEAHQFRFCRLLFNGDPSIQK